MNHNRVKTNVFYTKQFIYVKIFSTADDASTEIPSSPSKILLTLNFVSAV